MHPTPTWNLDPTRILTRRELATVLAKSTANRKPGIPPMPIGSSSLSAWPAATGCASEIGGLQMDDVVVGVARPHPRLRAETEKAL